MESNKFLSALKRLGIHDHMDTISEEDLLFYLAFHYENNDHILSSVTQYFVSMLNQKEAIKQDLIKRNFPRLNLFIKFAEDCQDYCSKWVLDMYITDMNSADIMQKYKEIVFFAQDRKNMINEFYSMENKKLSLASLYSVLPKNESGYLHFELVCINDLINSLSQSKEKDIKGISKQSDIYNKALKLIVKNKMDEITDKKEIDLTAISISTIMKEKIGITNTPTLIHYLQNKFAYKFKDFLPKLEQMERYQQLQHKIHEQENKMVSNENIVMNLNLNEGLKNSENKHFKRKHNKRKKV